MLFRRIKLYDAFLASYKLDDLVIKKGVNY